jgi:pimeloyl-ACP methyl ester carboxylesterase
MAAMTYSPKRTSNTQFVDLRGLRCHVRTWGDAGAPKLFLLHGWMDISASWQFMVDELEGNWHIIAPDWRGFGKSQWCANGYWFPDYYADLDALLEHFSPRDPANLVGHSMGGNVACIYAGVRPQRVRRLVSMEGFGLPATNPEEAPARIAKWLDELRGPPTLKPYSTVEELAARLRDSSKQLSKGQAHFLASEHATGIAEGKVAFSSDPFHKATNPLLYRLNDAKACWRRISAPTLWMMGDASKLMQHFYSAGHEELEARAACFADLEQITLAGAGHMLHHDQPQVAAKALERFLAT